MKKFRYKAKTSDGKTVKGIVEANNDKGAIAILRSNNLVVTELKIIEKSNLANFLSSFQRISTNDVVDFTRQLATMVGAGLPLTDSLANLTEQARPAMAKVLTDVVNDVRSGVSLYDALAKHPKVFSPIYLALVKSGEAAGLLDTVLKKLADNLEKQRNFGARIKSAMVYPVIVTIAMVVVAFLMMILVIPKLLSMYKEMGATLPLPTLILITVSNFMVNFWWLMLIIIFGGLYGAFMWNNTFQGRKFFDSLWFKIPVVNTLKIMVILTDLTRTLSMLVATGVSIIEALNIVSKAAGNVIVEDAIKNCGEAVEKGVPLATAFSRYEFFPPLLSQMVAVGEQTGKLDEVLGRVAIHFEEQSDLAIKGLTSAIEPLMIILLGIGVGFLVIAVIMPIYNLTAQF